MESLGSYVTRRMGELKNARSSWDAQWHDISEYIMPNRGMFSRPDQNQRGRKKGYRIINGTATKTLRNSAAGMMAGMSSPSRPWFRVTLSDQDLAQYGPVKVWLDDVSRIVLEVLARSNFYTAASFCYEEILSFGTDCVYVAEDDQEIVRFYPFTVGTYYLANDSRMRVDTFAREYKSSASQLVDRFGFDKVSEPVKQAFKKGNYGQMFDVNHLIEPNSNRDPRFKDNKNMPYRSIYSLVGAPDGSEPLEVGGFEEFPILAGRWDIAGNEAYGSGCPGMDMLGDVKQLQFMEMHKAKTLDKINDPPLQAPAGIGGKRVSLLPGDVTWVNPQQNSIQVSPIHVPDPRAFQFTSQEIGIVEQRIRRFGYEDLFLMLQNAPDIQRTAAEILERKEEKMMVLGPVLERKNDEFFDPLIERVFNICFRKGLIPEPPEELAEMELRLEYISVLAQAQKAVGIRGVDDITQYIGNLVAVNPDAMDKLNLDEAIDVRADMLGVPARIIRTDDEVAAIREQKAKQQQMAQMAQMAKPMNDMAGAMQKLGQTSPDEGSLIAALAGGAQ